MRAANNAGVYDIYTNMMHYPANMQHTHARWEEVPPPSSGPPTLETSASTSSSTPSSDAPLTPTSISQPSLQQPTSMAPKNTPSLSSYLYYNALTIDTVIAAPPTSTLGIPGPDGRDSWDIGPKGLCNVEEEVLEFLPPECLAAFKEARAEEIKWKSSWGPESGPDGDGRRWEGRRGY